MADSDHLIERAAALLQGKSQFRPDTTGLDGSNAASVTAAPAPGLSVPAPPAFGSVPGVIQAGLVQTEGGHAEAAQIGAAQSGPARPDLSRPNPSSPGISGPGISGPGITRPRPATSPTRADAQVAAPIAPDISLDALEQAGMVVARTARTRISEEYRIVVGRVLRALRTEPEGGGIHNLVLVTSARPGEGKSFSSLNLAGSIAQHGTDKVLLIDLDAKQVPLSAQLGVSDRIGLHDLIVNPALRQEDAILSTAIPNLQFMPVGTRVTEAMETTGVRPMPPTIARIARRFPKHIIILDAPPCLSTSDPHTIAPHVGQVVMVVEAERTQRTEVEAAIDLVRVCPTITILLNKVKLTTSHTFGAYDYYGSYS